MGHEEVADDVRTGGQVAGYQWNHLDAIEVRRWCDLSHFDSRNKTRYSRCSQEGISTFVT